MLNFRLARPAALVDLGGIEELAGIRVEDGALVVGAMTRQWDLEHSPDAFPLLREALAYVGHTATRCRGTVGGSLVHADPTAELPVCALALGAELVTNRRDDPGGGVLRLGLHDRARAGRAARRGALPGARRPDRVRRARPSPRRLRRRLRRARTATGSPSAGSPPTPVLWDGGELDPVGDLFAPAGYKREVARALIEQAAAA